MADFHARSGDADVLASGTVIAFEQRPIEISFGSPTFTLIFNFVDENSTPGSLSSARVEGKVHSPEKLELTLFNFTNPLGTGSTAPIAIGLTRGLLVYLQYRVFALVGGDKMLHFTVFGREEPSPPKSEVSS